MHFTPSGTSRSANTAASKAAFSAAEREAAVQQQVAQFQEVGLLGELFDGIAPVEQGARIAVDVGDVGVAGRRGNESRVVGEIALAGQAADVDDILAKTGFEDGKFDGLIEAVDVQAGVPALPGLPLVAADRAVCRTLCCMPLADSLPIRRPIKPPVNAG